MNPGAAALPPYELIYAKEGSCYFTACKKGRVVQGPGGSLWDEDMERGLCRERHQRRAQLDTSFEPMELAAPS